MQEVTVEATVFGQELLLERAKWQEEKKQLEEKLKATVGDSGGFPAMGLWNIGMSCDVHLHGLPSHASGSETGELFKRDRLEQFYFAKNKNKAQDAQDRLKEE